MPSQRGTLTHMNTSSEPKKLVLADHERLFRDGLKLVLAEIPGIQVVAEADNGPAAAEAVKRHQADLLLSEMDLPYWNGAVLARQVRKVAQGTTVVLLTRNTREDLLLQAVEAGARGILVKDATLSELRDALQTALGGKKVYLHKSLPPTLVRVPTREEGPAAESRFETLSPREREVLKLLVLGNRNQDVAELLGISVKTVEIHRARIMEKLHLHRLAHLVHYSIEKGLIDAPKGTPVVHMPFTPRRGRPAGSRNKASTERARVDAPKARAAGARSSRGEPARALKIA
jgi:DNA-binding NarL/FixJ family response regulator